eukprot:TRINITY_DN33818_c0_g1_i1.p1 TRINITY_DN33818_c0_g1~~TRINITY_DN33818_c0_g1_i1.p1  ORF type:complete len:170 (-),score=12.65 TRINITY_DN33818_c0_g1_i1:281-754(-)
MCIRDSYTSVVVTRCQKQWMQVEDIPEITLTPGENYFLNLDNYFVGNNLTYMSDRAKIIPSVKKISETPLNVDYLDLSAFVMPQETSCIGPRLQSVYATRLQQPFGITIQSMDPYSSQVRSTSLSQGPRTRILHALTFRNICSSQSSSSIAKNPNKL